MKYVLLYYDINVKKYEMASNAIKKYLNFSKKKSLIF